MSSEQSMEPALPPGEVRCRYQGCQQAARMMLVLELDRGSMERPLCDSHEPRAQEVARQCRAMAYRLYRF